MALYAIQYVEIGDLTPEEEEALTELTEPIEGVPFFVRRTLFEDPQLEPVRAELERRLRPEIYKLIREFCKDYDFLISPW